jgi:hypothetical protein
MYLMVESPMQTYLSHSTSLVALLNCGDNPDALTVAQGLASKGYNLLLVCHPTLQEAAELFRQTVEESGRQCTVVVRRITSIEFYRQLLSTIYLNFGWLNVYIDYATPHNQKPTEDQAQLSATLLWLYLQFLPPPIKEISYHFMRRKMSA